MTYESGDAVIITGSMSPDESTPADWIGHGATVIDVAPTDTLTVLFWRNDDLARIYPDGITLGINEVRRA